MPRWTVGWCIILALALPTILLGAEDRADAFVPPESLAEGWYASIETSMGDVLAQLLPEQAPQSVAYFTSLARGTLEWFDRFSGKTEKGPYYDGIYVQRSEAGIVFEVGDRVHSGRGMPEIFVPKEGKGPINFHRAGRSGMIRSAGDRISGVEFFVTASPQPRFSGVNPCFGRVVSGLDVVFEISAVRTYRNGRPLEPIVIEKIRVFPVGDPPPLPEPMPFVPTLKKPSLKEGIKK